MIRSFYHHGADVPATDLNQEQMQAALADAGGLLWVDVVNAEPETIEKILTDVFRVHPLTISDCIEGVRRPKLHDHGKYVFCVVYADEQNPPTEDITPIELDMFVGPNFVVTLHPLPLPAIDRTAERATQDEWMMNHGADTLAYQLLDAVASDYKSILNYLSAAIAGLEIELLTAPTNQTLRRLHELRQDNTKIWRLLAPQYDVVSRLATEDFQPIQAKNRLYFRDLAENFDQIVDTTERLDATVHDALQTHQAVAASQTNSRLRLVATLVVIILPLTVLGLLFDTGVGVSGALSRPTGSALMVMLTVIIALVLGIYVYHRD